MRKDRRTVNSYIERAAAWTYAHWTWIAGAAIALALALTLALLPGPSAGSLTSPSVGTRWTQPAPLSSTPAWPAPTTTTTTAPPPLHYTPPVQHYVPTPTPTAVSASGDCTPNEDYALDATTTDTPDWCAIRVHENGGSYGPPCGAYGFTFAYPADPGAQDALALQLFAKNGDHFSGTWNNPATASDGGPLR